MDIYYLCFFLKRVYKNKNCYLRIYYYLIIIIELPVIFENINFYKKKNNF